MLTGAFRLLVWVAMFGTWLTSAIAQEGLFIEPEHRAAKLIIQTHPTYHDEFQKATSTLSNLIKRYEAVFGRNSIQVGVLLFDIGEATVKRAETAAGDERRLQFERGARALQSGETIVKRFADRYDAGPITRARGLYYLGTALKELGKSKEAELALRSGLAAHWKKYNDHAYQLKFFEPLYEVTPVGAMKLRTAETWLKFANAFGANLDKDEASINFAAARDMTAANIKYAADTRMRAENLASTGDEAGAYAMLQTAFSGKSPSDRRILTARLKPSSFFVYRDPRVDSALDRRGDQSGKPLSAYDRVATRFFVANNLMPFVREGRNNLMALLNDLVATYHAKDSDGARLFCRLIPENYNGYDGTQLPQSCSNSVSWASWYLSMGNVDNAKKLLEMAIDLGRQEGDKKEAKEAVLRARIELASLEALYGSPDDFLQVLDDIDRQAGERAIPTGLRFYAGVLRDAPTEVELALRAAGHFDNLTDAFEEESSETREAGARLRDRLSITGKKVAEFLCRTNVSGLPTLAKLVQCRRTNKENMTDAMLKPADNATLRQADLFLAAAPELEDVIRAIPAEEILKVIDHEVFRSTPNDIAARHASRQVLEKELASNDMSELGIAIQDIDYGSVVRGFVERKNLALARDWARAGYSYYQTMSGGATIFSAWLIEGFREKRFREGWLWLAARQPILAEAAFADFVPSDGKPEAEKEQIAEFDWTRTIGGLHGRMLARESLGDDLGARADARLLVAYAKQSLRRQSFSRFETRDLIARATRASLMAAVHLLTGKDGQLERAQAVADFDAAFEALQLMRASTTATTVTRLAARLSVGAPTLALLARQREDLRSEWERNRAVAVIGKSDSVQRARTLANSLTALDKRISNEFPAYVELASTSAVEVTKVMSALGSSRSLIALTIAGDDLYLTAASSEVARIRRVDGCVPELRENARTLRESLVRRDGRYLRFRTEEGRAIYRQIVVPLADILLAPGRNTMIEVSDGPLDGIPLSILPTDENGNYLVDAIAGARLPSISSLVLLVGIADRQSATDPFLGIGDPVLEGVPSMGRGIEQSDVFAAAGGIDPARLRNLPRLPETAAEIRRISELLAAGPDSIVLGKDATESRVRKRPLSSYRILAFATHGLVAGEYAGLREPGLVMTPPTTATEEDDGFLSASEIGSLNLTADLVILSACNTASSSGSPGAEGLSGLSKAFFFAGARGLLVSHWNVDSDAAARLTTQMIEGRQSGRAANYPEALRAAMIRLRNEAKNEVWKHPGFWGAFEIVGD